MYICWGGYLEEERNQMLSYYSERKDCVSVKENMFMLHVQRLMEEVMREALKGREM